MTRDRHLLAARFDSERPRLVTLAARVLDSRAEAEDVVQEAWLRLGAADAESISNVGGWLSTVVARAAIDRLRQRRWRAETQLDDSAGYQTEIADPRPGPEAEAIVADAVGIALVVVLDRLGPAERMAFVLHDLFGLSFDEVATIVGRTPAAARQLASRARRRVRAPECMVSANLKARADIVAAFAKASRDGQMEDLLRLLDPDVTLTIDQAALPAGVPSIVRGAGKVAERAQVGARASAAEVMLVDGEPGLVVATDGQIERILAFVIDTGGIVAIRVITDNASLTQIDLRLLGDVADQAR
jgi:RNA polymerase sigma factor (sigma-70 family)